MSSPISSTRSPGGEFQHHFGGPPGAGDVAADCKKWEQLCGELLAEREKLRDQLERMRTERDRYRKSLGHLVCKDLLEPEFTKEEMLAFVDRAPPLEELIAELETDARKRA